MPPNPFTVNIIEDVYPLDEIPGVGAELEVRYQSEIVGVAKILSKTLSRRDCIELSLDLQPGQFESLAECHPWIHHHEQYGYQLLLSERGYDPGGELTLRAHLTEHLLEEYLK